MKIGIALAWRHRPWRQPCTPQRPDTDPQSTERGGGTARRGGNGPESGKIQEQSGMGEGPEGPTALNLVSRA